MEAAKKLQVFVSSTYLDLKEERQAAVEAILAAGHIPAGMELFTSGDQTQMTVIRQWIDESDVFLLILGGRYGSLETTTGKSYIQLEYEYATETGKPYFAVVIEDDALELKVKSAGSKVMETENPGKWKEFRAVVLSKMSRFWSDSGHIKAAIFGALGQLSRRTDLVGWIPGNQMITVEQLARMTKENADLKEENEQLRRQVNAPTAWGTFNGLTYFELSGMLADESVQIDAYQPREMPWGQPTSVAVEIVTNLLEFLWNQRKLILSGTVANWHDAEYDCYSRLQHFGILRREEELMYDSISRFELTPDGRKFVLRLMANRSSRET